MRKIWEWILEILGIRDKVPSWDKATLSSNWNGTNAQQRMMNILSPLMSDAKFKERVEFMKSRGVNTAHVFVTNKKDGECAGYSPFGQTFTSYVVQKGFTDVMTRRLKELRKNKWAVVLWMMADDSNDWAKDVASSAYKADKYCKAVKDLGWFDMASTVVVGLEMNEYWGVPQVQNMVAAIRKYYKGKIGTHHTSGAYTFAGFGDILFWQCEPGKSVQAIKADTSKALTLGKPVNFFELQRNPNRTLCQAAMDAGAFAVGNW